MKKFKVYGNVNVVVTKEVWANSEEEAREKAYNQLPSLTAYCGNGGFDKLVGVDAYDASVELIEDIEYDDTEVLEDDPEHFECPDCGEECEVLKHDDGSKYYCCTDCDTYYDEDGYEFYPDDEDEEEEQ